MVKSEILLGILRNCAHVHWVLQYLQSVLISGLQAEFKIGIFRHVM
jgi:hypothetical protein